MENNINTTEQGLLDLTVKLSAENIIAGNQFAIFVLVKNPFKRPVWIESVNVSLPSELELVLEKEIEKEKIDIHKKSEKEDKNADIEKPIIEKNKLTINNSNSIEINTSGSVSPNIEIIDSDKIVINSASMITNKDAKIISLKSSLPNNTALQSGSTAVFTAVLTVKKSLIFIPSKYFLQFNVNYSFNTQDNKLNKNNDVLPDIETFTNTTEHTIYIRPSIYSVMIGAAIGGLLGAVINILKTNTYDFNILMSVPISIILSGIAVVFMSRKSDTQSFVSVEDFWGGLLIGFLVGYTGTSFFDSMTGINPL